MFIISTLLWILMIVMCVLSTFSLIATIRLLISIRKYGVLGTASRVDPLTATLLLLYGNSSRLLKSLTKIAVIGYLFVLIWFIWEVIAGTLTWTCLIITTTTIGGVFLLYTTVFRMCATPSPSKQPSALPVQQ